MAQDDESETNVRLNGSARLGLSYSDPGGDEDGADTTIALSAALKYDWE